VRGDRIIISVDGGGTHTTAVAVTTAGEIVGKGTGGPANHVLAPIEVVRASLREAIGGAIGSAGASERDVLIIAGDTAGIGYLREGAEYVEGIIGEFFPKVPVYLVGDMVAGFYGALTSECGVVATAGTGSSIYGKNGKGEALQAGGWGHILGDEGSAYDIAVRGLRAAARAYDGREGATRLTEAFPQHFSLPDMISVAVTIYVDKSMTRDRIAEAAVVVAEEAEKGDRTAVRVMEEAGDELALAVVTVGKNLNIGKGEMKVSWSGSVFLAGELVIAPFSDAVRNAYPDAEIGPPDLPAVGGGIKVAFDRLGLDFSKVRDTVRKGLS
jgi:N-acetylglucosamine kinase-like BadF-type ATPase